jgi:AcrR family transcriptional regulator
MGKRMQNRLETEAAIFDAAVALIERQGYDNTTVEEICAAADVGRATFFRHFETKAGLLREYNRRLAENAADRLSAMDDAHAVARLAAIADAVHDAWASAGPGVRRLGGDAAALADPTGERTHPELIRLVLRVVRDGLDAGELRTELPPPLVAHLVVDHLAGAAWWWFDHPDDDLRALLDHSLEQCVHGLGNPSTRRTNGNHRRSPRRAAASTRA